jgi:tryptophan synthase alpha subunit
MSSLTLKQVRLTGPFVAEQHQQLDLVLEGHTQEELVEHLYRDLTKEELAVALAKHVSFNHQLRDALGYAVGVIVGSGLVALMINYLN